MAAHRPSGPRIELRLFFLGLLIMAGLAALIARLWWVQVARGPFYAAKIASRSQVTVRIPSVRGEIRDRNGLVLVANRASYDVDFYLPDMVRHYKQRSGGILPKIGYRARDRRGMLKNREEADIVQIVNSTIIPRLHELKLAQDYNARRLQRHYRTATEVPFVYLEDIDFPTIARFSEHNVGLPGVDIVVRPVRRYLYGALAAHLLGYVGMPEDISSQPDVREFNFYQPDMEGKSNIEQVMDKWLRGTPGVRILERNVKGQIDGEIGVRPPKPGNNVYLTIDARIQTIVENALRVVGRGAAVVVDPNNGDILAMASVPSFDPNIFIPSVSVANWNAINADETDPLTNRAISAFAPGSTYKIVTALAGLRKGIANARFTCSGGVTYGNKYMQCWVTSQHMAPHGNLGLTDAIKHSCNAFFYQFGNAAGIDNIDAVGEELGLGQLSGLGLSGESPGILPGPKWLNMFNPRERWSNGHTANVAIGQGYVLASPLQMAMVTATVANGGIAYQPRLVDRVLTPDGQPVVDENGRPVVPPPQIRTNLANVGVTAEQVELIRKGMWKVVMEDGGTARRARIPGIEVAGKTGTAQFWRGNKKDNHVWFICFAPYDKPKLALCVLVQGGKAGGRVAAPIARKIIEETLALEKGHQVEVAWMEPAKGNFQHVEEVSFDTKAPVQFGPDETADHTDSPDQRLARQQSGASRAKPDIRAEADEQGRVRSARAQRALQHEQEGDRRSIFERIFRPRHSAPSDRRR